MTDDQRRITERRLEDMAIELKDIADRLGSSISLNVYPDKPKETKSADIYIQFDPQRTARRDWYVSHESPHFRGLLTEIENKIHMLTVKKGREK